MSDQTPAPAAPSRMPWLGNAFGAISFDAAPAAPTASVAPEGEPKKEPPKQEGDKPKKEKKPFAPVTVHVHTSPKGAAKKKPGKSEGEEK